MQVFKWDNGLALRLPAAVVEALELREGDDVEVVIAGGESSRSGRSRLVGRCLTGFANIAAGCPPISRSVATMLIAERQSTALFSARTTLFQPLDMQRVPVLIHQPEIERGLMS